MRSTLVNVPGEWGLLLICIKGNIFWLLFPLMQPTSCCSWFHLETLIWVWNVGCSSVPEVRAVGGHPAEWHVLHGQVPYCPGGDAQANQPHCFPKEKQNFMLSKNMQNFLLTNKKNEKNLTKQTKETKPGKPTQDCRRCPDCAVEDMHVLGVTFPLVGLFHYWF